MRNLKTMRVLYWVNVSESSGAGSPKLSKIRAGKWLSSLLLYYYY